MPPVSVIAIVNGSTRVTNDDVATMAAAVHVQLTAHVAPAWMRTPPDVRFYTDLLSIAKGTPLIVVMDAPDSPNALGYHFERDDQVQGKVFASPVLDNGGSALGGPDLSQPSVSSVLSHEVLELFGDWDCNFWVDGPAIEQGSTYALELCDAVEGDSYQVAVATSNGAVPVQVSNFLMPAWFDPENAGPLFDWQNKLKAPFTMSPGGYLIVRAGGPGTESQVMGETMPDWKRKLKALAGRGAARIAAK
jgi:hypothetical protein